jgi:hypothetical protein
VRRLGLAALITLGSIALVGISDLALAPEFKSDLWQVGTAVADHIFVKALVFVAVVTWLLSICAAAWERSERRYRAELEQHDETSLMDDSPQGPLPETWRAPCGELVRFPDHSNDRGPKAA